jgi:hypothetical protein
MKPRITVRELEFGAWLQQHAHLMFGMLIGGLFGLLVNVAVKEQRAWKHARAVAEVECVDVQHGTVWYDAEGGFHCLKP